MINHQLIRDLGRLAAVEAKLVQGRAWAANGRVLSPGSSHFSGLRARAADALRALANVVAPAAEIPGSAAGSGRCCQ